MKIQRLFSDNQKIYAAALLSGAALVLSAIYDSASAQQSVTIKGRQLQKVDYYHDPIQVQVIDEHPRVKYFPRTEEAGQAFNISTNLGPAAGASSRTLPKSGFGVNSNVSARPVGLSHLSPVKSGLLSEKYAQEQKKLHEMAARPIVGHAPRSIIAAPVRPVANSALAPAATYSKQPITSTFIAKSQTESKLRGILLDKN